MSRLDSFIRRMSAQRDVLNDLAGKIDDVPGMICEFGLGSGRTYDHLRGVFPTRRVVVFDLVPCGASARRVSPPTDLILGDVRETSVRFPEGAAALVHVDVETGDPAVDAELAGWLPQVVARLLGVGGYAASSSPLIDGRLAPCRMPPEIAEGRYFLFRRENR